MFNNQKKKSEDVETPAEDEKKTKTAWKASSSTYYNLLTAIKANAPFKLESHSANDEKSNVPETKSEELDIEKETKKVSPDLARKK